MARTELSESEKYSNRLFAPEDSSLKKIRGELTGTVFEGINVAPFEGRFLQMLIELSRATKIVEIGTLFGYSTLWMARALPEEGKVFSIDRNQENHRKAKEFFKNIPEREKVQLMCGDGLDMLYAIESHAPFDMVFIDANKGGYLYYLDWAEKFVRPGGLIIGDNTLLFGHVCDAPTKEVNITETQVQIMREFNERMSDPKKFTSVLLPTREGMTIAIKK
ncbi:MAG: O-methyltransferase [Bdellovibrionales bacterium]|nr:O-methyltransferase [Bdellovibrionales bacterium]